MKRRQFIRSFGTAAVATALLPGRSSARSLSERALERRGKTLLKTDLVILGGGLGGCAAALAALRAGLKVVMTEETDWVGGQLTQQGVPPDENRWIETHGCTRSYRSLRNGIRDYYRHHFPLTSEAAGRDRFNPGDGFVSRVCHEPRVALAVIESMLLPFQASQQLSLLLEHSILSAGVDSDTVRAVLCQSHRTGNKVELQAPYFLDATELGDVLPLAGVEHVIGAESRQTHGEIHAPEAAQPTNQQAFTVCFAMDHIAGEDHRIDRPLEYDFWRNYQPRLEPAWPGKLVSLVTCHPQTLKPRLMGFNPTQDGTGDAPNLWCYRRIARQANFRPGAYPGDITLVNWPQNDYWLGNLAGVSERTAAHHLKRAKQLNLSLLYWLQTEVPRPDGGNGWPGLRLRGDVLGTEDGFAKYPYIRESRRIRAEFTITEAHCGREARAKLTGQPEASVGAESYFDTVGIGHYNIDLHPSSLGNNYVDIPSLPFQIPLGALLPVRVKNLLPASKNLGTTHITNGCYRLHPVEWNIGEAAGALVAFALKKRSSPHAIREDAGLLSEFQTYLRQEGVETHWPA